MSPLNYLPRVDEFEDVRIRELCMKSPNMSSIAEDFVVPSIESDGVDSDNSIDSALELDWELAEGEDTVASFPSVGSLDDKNDLPKTETETERLSKEFYERHGIRCIITPDLARILENYDPVLPPPGSLPADHPPFMLQRVRTKPKARIKELREIILTEGEYFRRKQLRNIVAVMVDLCTKGKAARCYQNGKPVNGSLHNQDPDSHLWFEFDWPLVQRPGAYL